ncbi:MAG: hypothetical protein LBL72_09870 [Candidatus Accumulibacter sp.]|jgi:hypothetical protein|nr:hypothetical protein [Accumulibacter sp.]
MLSLRAIFRFMLLAWFALVFAMGAYLTSQFDVKAPLPAAPPAPPPAPVEPPVEPPPPPPPVPEPPSPWKPLPYSREAGKGRMSVPVITLQPGGALEIRLPYQGTPGGETHFSPRDVGIKTDLNALSVDLHGKWRLERATNVRPKEGALCRVQIYWHPNRIRVSGVACDPAEKGKLKVSVGSSETHIRILFSFSPTSEKGAHGSTAPL